MQVSLCTLQYFVWWCRRSSGQFFLQQIMLIFLQVATVAGAEENIKYILIYIKFDMKYKKQNY